MRAVESLEIFTLMGFFCPKHIKIRWKSTEELCLMSLKSEAKLEEKVTLSSKNDMRNLVNFNVSCGKSENLHFDVLLLSIAKRKNYLSWHWKDIQSLKKNRRFVWKMKWEIWWTLTQEAESLKICTLMG